MNRTAARFYVNQIPLTALMFAVGTFLYGGMSIYGIVTRGFHWTGAEFGIYGWGVSDDVRKLVLCLQDNPSVEVLEKK